MICSECGWFGYCHFHHKDGNHQNTDPANIRILCPNCHTEVHHGKPVTLGIFENSDLISMREAARQLEITFMTLHRWCNKGKIQAIKVGAYRAIPKSEIERLKGKDDKLGA